MGRCSIYNREACQLVNFMPSCIKFAANAFKFPLNYCAKNNAQVFFAVHILNTCDLSSCPTSKKDLNTNHVD